MLPGRGDGETVERAWDMGQGQVDKDDGREEGPHYQGEYSQDSQGLEATRVPSPAKDRKELESRSCESHSKQETRRHQAGDRDSTFPRRS